jgi:hypothetical protein
MSNVPFQMARGVAYLVGGVLLAGGALLFLFCAFYVVIALQAKPGDLLVVLVPPLIIAGLCGCGIAAGGLYFISKAQDAKDGEP